MRILSSILLLFMAVPTIAEPAFASKFFAFDNGVGRGDWSPDEQARVLSELGYSGIGYSGTEQLEERLAAFEKHGISIYNLYVPCYVDREEAYGQDLLDAIKMLEGKDVALWLTVQGRSESDDRAVTIIREIADAAVKSGVRVVLYPHFGFYVADIQDAIRVVKKVDRNNVGVTLNLCHELRAGNEAKIFQSIDDAGSLLEFVSINGADKTGGWDRLIQRLGEGEYDVPRLLSKLADAGYVGPIGLQCYQVPGDAKENLDRNIAQWKSMMKSMN